MDPILVADILDATLMLSSEEWDSEREDPWESAFAGFEDDEEEEHEHSDSE